MLIHPMASAATAVALIAGGLGLALGIARRARGLRALPVADLAAAGLVSGFAWFSVLVMVAHAADLGLATVQWVLWGSGAAGTAYLLLDGRRRVDLQPPARGDLLLGLGVFIVGASIPAYFLAQSPAPTVSLLKDDLAHTAQILQVIHSGDPFPPGGFYASAQALGADPRFGVVHALYALLLAPWASDITHAWLALSVPASGLLLLCLAYAYRPWFTLSAWTAVAILAQAAFWGGGRFALTKVAAYPMWIGIALFLLVWGLLERNRRDGAPANALNGALWLAPTALVSIHYFAAGALLGLIAIYAIVAYVFDRRRAVASRLILVMLSVLPALAYRLVTSYGSVNPIHQEPWLSVALPGGLRTFQPAGIYSALGAAGMVAVACAALELRRALKVPDARGAILSSLGLGPLVLVGVPPISSFGMAALGFLWFRLLLLIPVGLLLTLQVARLAPRRLAFGLVLVLLVVVPVERTRDWAGTAWDYDAGLRRSLKTGVAAVGTGRTILANPYVSLALAGDFDVPVVAVPDGRSSPRDPDARERLLCTSAAACSDLTARQRWTLARRFDADLLWVQLEGDRDRHQYLYDYAAGSAARIRTQLLGHPESFRIVHDGQGSAIFEILDQAPPPSPPMGPRMSRAPNGAITVADGALAVWTASELPTSAAPGDSLSLHLRWLRIEAGETLAWDASLRLDHAERVGGIKVVRKAREILTRQRFRASWTFQPAGGRLPAPMWPPGLVLDQYFPIRLPLDLAPGRYVLRVDVEPAQRSRERLLGDYIWDDDSLSGPVIATLDVR